MSLTKKHNIYFIGIGGIGMSALARYFKSLHITVAGYDKVKTKITDELESLGIFVSDDEAEKAIPSEFHNPANTLVVFTPAVPQNHKQLQYFRNENFDVVKRAEVLGLITKDTFCFAVAGTHGKTTTSCILGHIMKSVGATSFLGGIAENYQSNLILGKEKISVVEADEFDRSFLKLSPDIACVTSMDADHLDIYENHDDLKDSFKEFINTVSKKVIVAEGLDLEGMRYGFEENSDFQAKNIRIQNGSYVFDIQTPKELIQDVEFSLPGRHNMMNALAATAMASLYNVEQEIIKSSLKSFKGVQRRFSYRIKNENLILIDDYAHHPKEINAVFNAIKELYPNEKNMVIFQPHLYTRTRDFIDDFALSLSQFDEIRILDIYPARELPIERVNSNWLLSKISSGNKKLTVEKNLKREIENSDAKVVAMLGAGDIGVMIENVVNELNKTKVA